MKKAWEREGAERIRDAEEKEAPEAVTDQAEPAEMQQAKSAGGPSRLDEVLAELDAMIGLENVKAEVRSALAQIRTSKKRVAAGLSAIPVSRHMVFSGNPGTGKTTVARIIGAIFRESGLLRSGHLVEAQRAEMIGQYVGQTGPKTRNKCLEALDGVLFLDEAYTLVRAGNEKDFGAEAVEEIMTFMEENRDRMVVIAAGYKQQMADFIASNPGLASRFSKTIEFEDFSASELERIFEKFCTKEGFVLGDGAAAKVKALMLGLLARKGDNFGNARTVRNAYQATVDNYSLRIDGIETPTGEQLTTLEAIDIPANAEGLV